MAPVIGSRKYDGATQVSGINSKSKQVTCHKIKNIVRGLVCVLSVLAALDVVLTF